MGVQVNNVKSAYKFVDSHSSSQASRVSSGYGTASFPRGNIYYNIYNMPWSRLLYGTRWWLYPDEVVGGSRFVVSAGGDVYWLLRRFALDGDPPVNVLGVDASAGYGKSLAAVRLAVDLHYDGWLIIIGFHSHELGGKLFEYVLRYAFVRNRLTGKWFEKLVRIGPLALPRVVYVGGMERYCPFYDVVPDECGYLGSKCDEKIGYVVGYMLERVGVPRPMWGKSVRYLIEHKILNAKEFCEHCPFMRRKGRLRPVPKEYWPDSRSWLGPRILYTRDVQDIVERYLFPLMYGYDSRRGWRERSLKKYVKLLDPRAGVCPRRLLLKPIFSKKKKSGGFNNFWIYHGGLIILAPYELALKIARIAYHVRRGRRILLIIDEADALFFKKSYVPVFLSEEFRKEVGLFKAYVDFFGWLLRNGHRVDFGVVFDEFRRSVGGVVRKNRLFLRDLLSFVLLNRDRIKRVLEELYSALASYASVYYGKAVEDLSVDDVFDPKFVSWLSEGLAALVSRVDNVDEFYGSLRYLKDVGYESMRLWNILYVLSMGSQSRVVVREGREYESLGRFRYRLADVVVVRVGRKISPLYSLWLIRGAVSSVLLNGEQYYEYYPYLEEIFSLAKNVKVILLSATLASYYINMWVWFDSFAGRYGVRYVIRSLLSVNDVFDESLRKRVKVVVVDSLRDIRVHRFLRLLPKYLLSRFVLRFDSGMRELVEFIRENPGVVVIAQNKLSAEYVAKVVSGVLKERCVRIDSGYYIKGRVLITWLRSKLNRGVNIHDVAPAFVPRYFVFVGTFLAPIKRVKFYERGEPPSGTVFSLPCVRDGYFAIVPRDEVYGCEVLCWIEQFVGRALRVSRKFNIRVYVVLSSDILYGFGVSIYLLSVGLLPEYDEIVKTLDDCVKKYYKYKQLAEETSGKLREIFLKRADRYLDLGTDPVKMLVSGLGSDISFGFFAKKYPMFRELWNDYIKKVDCLFNNVCEEYQSPEL